MICVDCDKEIEDRMYAKIKTPRGMLCIDCWCKAMGELVEKYPIFD